MENESLTETLFLRLDNYWRTVDEPRDKVDGAHLERTANRDGKRRPRSRDRQTQQKGSRTRRLVTGLPLDAP